ncbi:hypothetical protein ACIPPS_07750 [Streptomyces sp. NPDC090127]|uniref:hypothetical protein n=1 Tax=Streptomyces sp. NPDC090127 TaxID=3365953 RepID=UPI0038068FDC
MKREGAWAAGPVGDGDTGRDALLALVEQGARGLPDEQVVTAAAVCELCGSGDFATAEFEVRLGECYCVGCLLPIGVRDGDVLARAFQRPGSLPWRLTHMTGRPDQVTCPEGHVVFQVAVALVLDGDAAARSVSVGLRCPEDGGLHLYVDNARVSERAPG